VQWDRKNRVYRLRINADERAVLRGIAPQFTALLDDPDAPTLRRVFPPAYSDPAHVDKAEEFRRLMQEDLVERHRAELQLLEDTAEADTLTEEQLLGWIRALNSIRLVLGTYLDISEDQPDAGDSPEANLYGWLTYLQGESVEALSGQT
jgi:hypothetical protein